MWHTKVWPQVQLHKEKGRFSLAFYVNACITFFLTDIVPKPNISCSKHKIAILSHRGKVECNIRNYTQFVNLSVVDNNGVNVIEDYPASEVCTVQTIKKTEATCTVPLGEGQYQICVSYNEDVEHGSKQFQCSEKVRVISSKCFSSNTKGCTLVHYDFIV